MKLHGDNACKFHGFEKYNPETDKEKPTMFWLYDEYSYKLLSSHKGKKYIFWHNQDVLGLLRRFQKYIPDVRYSNIVHVCHNELLRDELSSIGIYSLIRPIFWGDASKYVPSGNPLTKDCYITANAGRGVEYGEMIMNTLAWKYPDWNFHIFGIDPTIPVYCDNLKYYGWISEDEMDEIDKNFMVCFRFNLHDGFSQTVMKARMRGQAVITAISYKETNYYKSFDQLCDYFKNTDFLNFNPIEHSHFTNFDFII
jgi:hypothetical protein